MWALKWNDWAGTSWTRLEPFWVPVVESIWIFLCGPVDPRRWKWTKKIFWTTVHFPGIHKKLNISAPGWARELKFCMVVDLYKGLLHAKNQFSITFCFPEIYKKLHISTPVWATELKFCMQLDIYKRQLRTKNGFSRCSFKGRGIP